MNEWEVTRSSPISPKFSIPLSYSSFRSVKTCPLQFAFSHDSGYPPRVNPKARMGTAFHSALAFLQTSNAKSINDVIQFFIGQLQLQRAQAALNYRERRLSWPKDVREVMENTLAIRCASMQHKSTVAKSRIEIKLISPDGVLMGRPDEIANENGLPLIIDYKTGLQKDGDVTYPEEQIHFYAGLWAEVHGIMPSRGIVNYLITGYSHQFTIDPEMSRSLLAMAREIAKKLQSGGFVYAAVLGEHCAFCNYRPWCKEYWNYRKAASNESPLDMEGLVCSDHPRDSKIFCLRQGQTHISIVNKDCEALPSFESRRHLRCLDLVTQESFRFKTSWSELFQVVDNHI